MSLSTFYCLCKPRGVAHTPRIGIRIANLPYFPSHSPRAEAVSKISTSGACYPTHARRQFHQVRDLAKPSRNPVSRASMSDARTNGCNEHRSLTHAQLLADQFPSGVAPVRRFSEKSAKSPDGIFVILTATYGPPLAMRCVESITFCFPG